MSYIVKNHYWIVGGDTSQVWSSAAGDYVASDDAGYLAWLLADGMPTRIGSEVLLNDVLLKQYPARANWRSFSVAETLAALAEIDAAASLAAFSADELGGQESVAAEDPRLASLAAECKFSLGTLA